MTIIFDKLKALIKSDNFYNWILTILAVSTAFITRLTISLSTLGKLDSDEAIVLLMAKKISKGEYVIFFFGQQYGGSQEAILMSPFVKMFGMHTWVARIVPLFIFLVAVLTLMFGFSFKKLNKKFSDKYFWASLLLLNIPVAGTWFSIHSAGFYTMVMVCGIISFSIANTLATLEVPEYARIRYWIRTHKSFGYLLLGLVIGIGWWASPQFVLFLIPLIVLVLMQNDKETYRFLPFNILGVVIGSMPWLYANIISGFESFKTGYTGEHSFLDRLIIFIKEGPSLVFNLNNGLDPNLIGTNYGLRFIFALAIYIFFTYISLTIIIRKPKAIETLFALMFLIYPIIASINPKSFFVGEGRYLWFLTLPICILIVNIPKLFNRKTIFGLVISIILLSTSIYSYQAVLSNKTIEDSSPTAQYNPIIKELNRLHIKYIAADYWISYRIDAESNEQIIATPFLGTTRIQDYKEKVRENLEALLAYQNGMPDRTIQRYLRSEKIIYKKIKFQNFNIYRVDKNLLSQDQLNTLVTPQNILTQ